jgi:hypothetical protein
LSERRNAGHDLNMGIVDDLLAHPGLYLGVDHVLTRIVWGPHESL